MEKVEEVPVITYKDIPVRKVMPVPIYRAVFPDGSKKVLPEGILGYPVLPVPRGYDKYKNVGLGGSGAAGAGAGGVVSGDTDDLLVPRDPTPVKDRVARADSMGMGLGQPAAPATSASLGQFQPRR